MFADVDGHLLALVMVSVHQNPLDQVVAVLITRDVDEWDAKSVWVGIGDDSKIAIQKVDTTNLQTLFNNLGGKLINAVAVCVGKDVVDDSTLVRRRSMLADMLDAPIAELAMSDEVDIGDHLFDSGSLGEG